MKKILLILLIFIYSASTFGMVVKEFYCCGKLSSVSISFTTNLKEKSAKQSGCCKTQYHSSKVKDNHLAPDAIAFTSKHFDHPETDLFIHNIAAIPDPQLSAANGIHDPPLLHNSTPLYILIRVLLV